MQVVYRLAAGRDIAEARRWYDARRLGLGAEFRQAVRAVENLLATYPDAFPQVPGEIRRALVRRFPYAIYYQRLEADVGDRGVPPHEPSTRGPPGPKGTPNQRLKLTGPAFRGGVRLCPSQLVSQAGALAPAGACPAA